MNKEGQPQGFDFHCHIDLSILTLLQLLTSVSRKVLSFSP